MSSPEILYQMSSFSLNSNFHDKEYAYKMPFASSKDIPVQSVIKPSEIEITQF